MDDHTHKATGNVWPVNNENVNFETLYVAHIDAPFEEFCHDM